MGQEKDKVVAFLQNVALSETVNEYYANLRTLKTSNIWTSNMWTSNIWTKPSSVTFRYRIA